MLQRCADPENEVIIFAWTGDGFTMPDLSIGLALAGGGARGIAHIGILQVLEDHAIRPRMLAGTSAGAIIAAMYAARPDGAWVEQRFREFLESEAFRRLGTERLARHYDTNNGSNQFARRLKDHMVVNLSLMRRFIIPRERLDAAIEFLVPARRFEQLAIPLTVCATDLQQGAPVLYHSGDLVRAVSNSASIPGVLEPEVDDQTVIADGGVLSPVPVAVLKQHTDFAIASEISKRGLPPLEQINIYSLMLRAEQLTQMALARQQAAAAHFIFCPDVMSLHWSQFGAFDTLLENGIAEGRARIEDLQRELKAAASLWGRLRRRLRHPGRRPPHVDYPWR